MSIPFAYAPHNPNHNPPNTPPSSIINLSATLIHDSVLLQWDLPQGEIKFFSISRVTIGGAGGLVEIAKVTNNPDRQKIRDHSDTITDFYLDETVERNKTYQYRVTIIDPKDRKGPPTQSIRITIPPEKIIDTQLVSKGLLINTQSPITPFRIFSFDNLFPTVQASHNPLITTSINPKNEPFLFALTPIPVPNESGVCDQTVNLSYKRDQEFGQQLSVFATLLQNNTITNQHFFTIFSDSVKRQFNAQWNIDPLNQTLQNFTNLELQLDFDSSDTLNPLEYRSVAIFDIEFTVPVDNSDC